MVRLAVYGGISSLLTLSIIAAAFRQRPNFYAACIYLSKSSACIMILMNMGFFLTIILGKVLQAIFFGRLRAVEIEHLYERSWYAITETCLAMTIFRDEFNTRFVVTFTTLLFLKTFHWLCQDRVEFMEQSPAVPISFHVRMVSLMKILVAFDLILASYAINVTVQNGPNMMIIREEPWENKSIYVFYLELVIDFFKLIVYLIFFAIILVSYGIPLHIIRDVYVTLRSFLQKCGDLVRYRRATRNMNERYPNATNEELERLSDRTYRPRQGSNNNLGDVPKKLPCGHIFHFHCLRSWLERQQSCPTCRRPVLEQPTPAAQQQQQQRPIQAQAVRFIANAFPAFPTVMLPPPAMHGQFHGQLPMAPIPLANAPNVGEQANGINQNIPQPPHQNNPQETQRNPPQNSQSNIGDRSTTETHEESSSTSSSTQSQNQNNSTRRPNQPVASRILLDQSSSSNSRTFNNAQPSMPFQPINLSQLSMQTSPGLIPLFPVLPLRNNGIGNINNSNSNASSTTLEPLTEEQIRLLETNTRAAFEEKIRILQDAQVQIYNVISVLTQAVSALPSIPTSDTGSNINENSRSEEVKGDKGKGKSVTLTDEDELFENRDYLG
ncbi:1304_t:CDS:10 [Funneliformis mosseae]|uniref:RING-type E3 ubiquitin transferase n=1 Tax=Funneliformis mosseae TaxID=27381 RepID=A0A9N9HK56_FUNMO|nr:1304_t:CDS:10 [Funneliformis mosseae]